jgi:ABC-type branched-subunit amino acid transport system permease subunit
MPKAYTVAVFALAAVAPLFFSAGGDVVGNMVLAAFYWFALALALVALALVANVNLRDSRIGPGKLGLAFTLSEISSGIYGAILVVVMLLRPQGLVPARRTVERKPTLLQLAGYAPQSGAAKTRQDRLRYTGR